MVVSKRDEQVKTFLKTWFDRFNIRYKERVDKNYIGTTHSIHAYSTLLQQFLDAFVGRLAHNKKVPDAAFNAPDEFVEGVLIGYFSGDGHVDDKGSITAGSASEKLMDGVSLLLTRLGIFGHRGVTQLKSNNLGTKNIKPSHTIAIRAQWASVFGKRLTLLQSYKNDRLTQTKKCHMNYVEQNDVVFDTIKTIDVIPVCEEFKLYDVTVPSTYNFATASMLVVRDTSETGYIQRRLVKAMEDMKIGFDGLLKNSIGDIVQFAYGEDNFDGCKLSTQKIPKDLSWMKKYTQSDKVHLPLDIQETFEYVDHDLCTETTGEDVSHECIMDLSENNYLMRWMIEYYLKKYDHFTDAQLTKLKHMIHIQIQKGKVQAGEMVGTVAAQSLGQPITQMTLNSVEYNTQIVVSENGKLKEYLIGEWIESRIANGNEYQYIEKGDQTYAKISENEDIRILSSDEDGRVFWDHVDAVTKHLPINEDGTNTLIRITTLSGHECTVTKGESVLTRQNNKLLKSKGSDLRVGDYLPALRDFPLLENCKMNELDVSEYVPKTEFVYSSEVEKALTVHKECTVRTKKARWWKQNKGKRFELPYSRSDAFIDAYIGIGKRTLLSDRRLKTDPSVYPNSKYATRSFSGTLGTG